MVLQCISVGYQNLVGVCVRNTFFSSYPATGKNGDAAMLIYARDILLSLRQKTTQTSDVDLVTFQQKAGRREKTDLQKGSETHLRGC